MSEYIKNIVNLLILGFKWNQYFEPEVPVHNDGITGQTDNSCKFQVSQAFVLKRQVTGKMLNHISSIGLKFSREEYLEKLISPSRSA